MVTISIVCISVRVEVETVTHGADQGLGAMTNTGLSDRDTISYPELVIKDHI